MVHTLLENINAPYVWHLDLLEEVPKNMSCILSAAENTIIEGPQRILIYTFYVTLAYNVISIIVIFKAPALHRLASPLCPIGKIHLFSKISITLESVMQF